MMNSTVNVHPERTDNDRSSVQEMVLRPPAGWQSPNFRELAYYRELLYFLIWRDIKVRYKQTVIGAAWAIIQPVCTMVVFSVIFGRVAKIPSEGVPYPVFVYAGLMPWIFFSNAVSQSGLSLVNQANLLTKVYFPRLFVPSASIGAGLVDFALSFLVYLCIIGWYWPGLSASGHTPGVNLLFLPILVILTMMAAMGTGLCLSGLTVVYRDFRFVIPFMMQIWMFLTPVVYPVSILEGKYHFLLSLNPMTGIIGGYRSIFLNQPLDIQALIVSIVMTVSLFIFGLYYFKRTERRFADIA